MYLIYNNHDNHVARKTSDEKHRLKGFIFGLFLEQKLCCAHIQMFKPYFVYRLSPTSPSKLKMDSHFWPSWRETLKYKIVIVHQSLSSRDSQSEKQVNAKGRGSLQRGDYCKCTRYVSYVQCCSFNILCNYL